MRDDRSFGRWLRLRRRALDLTQDELAQRVGCSTIAIRKLEADERRPSKPIAARLAAALQLAPDQHAAFITFARTEPGAKAVEPLALPLAQPLPQHAPPRQSSLPAPLTRLIGRDHDLAAARNALLHADTRLLTLLGAPGIGKTRLGVQLAATLADTFADGVCFVALAPLRDPQLVGLTIAQALGVQESGAQPLLTLLVDHLRDKQILLLLDNCEHMLAAVTLISDLLGACPHLKVLATSRAALHVRGERQFPVAPLLVPNLARLPDLTALPEYSAVALFVERAQDIQPDFALSATNAGAVAAICAHLDGLPLTIELVAMQSKLLATQELLVRLRSRLALLVGGAHDLPLRQQTLRATLEWSYYLLAPPAQALFRRLGVFVGGWDFAAAEAVCADELVRASQIQPCLETLVAHSLVGVVAEHEDEPRFTMLETLREYALEQLGASGELETLQQRHAEYYLALAEAAELELRGPQQKAWLEQLEGEHDNLRAALAWCLETARDGAMGLRLAGALYWFWYVRGYWSEGLRSFEGALVWTEGLESTQARAKALYGAANLARSHGNSSAAWARLSSSAAIFRKLGDKGGLAAALLDLGYLLWSSGDDTQARTLYNESIEIFREVGERSGLGEALGLLGLLMADQGDLAAARALCEESLMLYQELDDQQGIAAAHGLLGEVARLQGDFKQARALYEQGVSIFRELGDRQIAGSLGSLGFVLLSQGDFIQAKALFVESLVLRQALGHQAGIVHCLGGLAGIAIGMRQPKRAAQLFGAAEALRIAIGARLWPADKADYDHNVAETRAQLDNATFAAAWEEGHTMPLEQAIAEALRTAQ